MSDQDKRNQFVFSRDGSRVRKVTRREIVEALRQFAKIKFHQQFTMREFDAWKDKPVSASTVNRIFDSWANAMKAAGLRPKLVMKRDVYEMVETFKKCWTENQSEPDRKHLQDYLRRNSSPYRWRSYKDYFGSLGRLSQRIEDYQHGKISEEQLYERYRPRKERTTVPLKVRYQVLKRDGERCVKCGASTKTDPAITLEIDHIVPVSKGGSDDLDNLQTLCSLCNQGKKDRDN
jgi:hypothetical protein